MLRSCCMRRLASRISLSFASCAAYAEMDIHARVCPYNWYHKNLEVSVVSHQAVLLFLQGTPLPLHSLYCLLHRLVQHTECTDGHTCTYPESVIDVGVVRHGLRKGGCAVLVLPVPLLAQSLCKHCLHLIGRTMCGVSPAGVRPRVLSGKCGICHTLCASTSQAQAVPVCMAERAFLHTAIHSNEPDARLCGGLGWEEGRGRAGSGGRWGAQGEAG